MTLPTTGALLAYNNRALGPGEFTATTGTWTTAPPIEHMGTMQVPVPFAQVTPAAGEIAFDFQAQDGAGDPQEFAADTIALLAHTLPPGAVVKFLDGATELAEIEWTPLAGAGHIAIAALDETVNLDTLTVSITAAGAAPVQIGGLWISRSFRHPFGLDGFSIQPVSYSEISRVGATPWTNGRASVTEVSFFVRGLTEAQAIGPGEQSWRSITRQIGIHAPVLIMPLIRRANDAIYGTIARFEPIVPQRKGVWSAGATVIGMV